MHFFRRNYVRSAAIIWSDVGNINSAVERRRHDTRTYRIRAGVRTRTIYKLNFLTEADKNSITTESSTKPKAVID